MAKRTVKKTVVAPNRPKAPKIVTTGYLVAFGDTTESFRTCMEAYLQLGYQPWGSPHFTKSPGDCDPEEVFCYQAMVLKEEVLDTSGHPLE